MSMAGQAAIPKLSSIMAQGRQLWVTSNVYICSQKLYRDWDF